MQNDGKFPSNSYLRLFHSVAFHQPKAPSLKRAPTLRAMEQNTGRLEEIGSQQTISPPRDLTDSVRLPRLLTSWSGPDKHLRMSRFESETGHQWYGGRSIPSAHRCPAQSSAALLFHLFEPFAGSGDPTPQVLDRYAHELKEAVVKPGKAHAPLRSSL